MKKEYVVQAILKKGSAQAVLDVIVNYHGVPNNKDILEEAKRLVTEGGINVLDSKHTQKDADGYVDYYVLTDGRESVKIRYNMAGSYILKMKIAKETEKEVALAGFWRGM